MSNDEIKELIQLVMQSGIAELEVQRGDARVRIRRTLGTATYVMAAPTMAASAPAADRGDRPTCPSAPSDLPPPANEHI